MRYLSDTIQFPPIETADEDGLLAIGGDLSSERLLLAYRSGIFPWFEEGQPLLWWSPDPRMVLYPADFKVSKSLRKTLRRSGFKVTFNSNFKEVIDACSAIERNGQQGTWITQQMKEAYLKLHQLGHAVSFETWRDGSLVGGGYGIDLPNCKVFCGESMFSTVSDASKVGFYHLVRRLQGQHYKVVDCQVYTSHLASLGAVEISRSEFKTYLSV